MYRAIFNNARHYSKGANLLYSNIFGGERTADYAPAGILCATFCIELLLKCLLLIKHDDVFVKEDLAEKGIRIDEHSYSILFNSLDADLQDRVVQTYNDLFSERITTDQYLTLLAQLGDRGFAEWRYVYETGHSKNLNVQLQNKITDSLGKCIETLLREKGIEESHQ